MPAAAPAATEAEPGEVISGPVPGVELREFLATIRAGTRDLQAQAKSIEAQALGPASG